VRLIIQPSDCELLKNCAPDGVKVNLGLLCKDMSSGTWQCPDPIEDGIWSIECGENVIYYCAKSLTCAVAYSVSLVNPKHDAGCSAVTVAQARRKARRLRTRGVLPSGDC